MNRPRMALQTLVCTRVEVVEEQLELTLPELCHSSGASAELVAELVAHGLLDPSGGGSAADWRFGGSSLATARRALRLMDDLGVNAAGAAVVITLVERLQRMQRLAGR